MKSCILSIVTIFVLAVTLLGFPHPADAGIGSFTQMMYRELTNTQKNAHEVTRVFEPTGRGSANEGDTDIRLTEVGSDYFCGLHLTGAANGLPVPMAKECWRDNEVASVAFYIVH